MVRNTVETGKIARYEQFLLLPSVFKRLVLQIHKNQGLFGGGLRAVKIQSTYRPRSFASKKIETLCGKRQILDCSELKEIVDDNFKFDENGGKFYIRVKNTLGKG